MIKFSIIIPVYNVEKYVSRCIESCLIQGIPFNEYEIIVINDGSTDESLKKVSFFAQNHSNIQIITTVNRGLSEARNEGIKYAKGEYLWFVDSDDWIEKDSLSLLYELVLKHNFPEMIAFSKVNSFDDTSKNTIEYIKITSLTNGLDYLTGDSYLIYVPTYIFKRSFWLKHHLSFIPGMLHEDAAFTPQALFQAKTIIGLETPLYFHYQRTGSITHTVSLKKCEDLFKVAELLYQFKHIHNDSKNNYFNFLIARRINITCSYLAFLNTAERNLVLHKIKQQKHLSTCMIQSRRLAYIIEGILIKISIKLFWRFYYFFFKRNTLNKIEL